MCQCPQYCRISCFLSSTLQLESPSPPSSPIGAPHAPVFPTTIRRLPPPCPIPHSPFPVLPSHSLPWGHTQTGCHFLLRIPHPNCYVQGGFSPDILPSCCYMASRCSFLCCMPYLISVFCLVFIFHVSL